MTEKFQTSEFKKACSIFLNHLGSNGVSMTNKLMGFRLCLNMFLLVNTA